MNDLETSEVDHTLRVFVEQVVRPICGEESQKLKMRKELYAHTTATYDEELVRCGSSETAVARTIKRMGPPQELTDDLQQTVSYSSRWSAKIDRIFRQRQGESRWYHSMRVALGGVAATLILTAMPVGGIVYLNSPTKSLHWWFLLLLTVLYGVNLFIGCWMGGEIRDRIDVNGIRGNLSTLLSWATAWALLFGLTGIGFLYLLAGAEAWQEVKYFLCWGALAVLLVPGSIAAAWLDVRERNGLEEWLALEIE